MPATVQNTAKDRLAAGELALGVILRQARTVDIAPAMKACGYDWLFLDLEHNSMDLDIAVQISVAALGVGMPHVDTPEEAKAIAAALRYPPQGHRSVAGGLPHLRYEKHPLAEICAAINDATMVIVMLETPLAIANADAIAAVPGIDSLLIGTNDLAMELGIPGGFGDERIVAAYQAVVARAVLPFWSVTHSAPLASATVSVSPSAVLSTTWPPGVDLIAASSAIRS